MVNLLNGQMAQQNLSNGFNNNNNNNNSDWIIWIIISNHNNLFMKNS